eukprot:GHVS01052750.1.p1 GENE.GHVS01052750.1~~GHVS01052750.1.p1  ORF type:complete len:116 (-),score=23.14 GHVS01052750.1:91-438(-)
MLQQVVINEGVVGLQVLYYLAFVVSEADRLIVPFKCFPPRLPTLVFIYKIVYPLLTPSSSNPTDTITRTFNLARAKPYRQATPKPQQLRGHSQNGEEEEHDGSRMDEHNKCDRVE